MALVFPININVSEKIQVAIAFGSRLAVVPVSAVHLAFISQLVTAPDPQLASAKTLALQQVMMGVSLLACTIPSIKSFLGSFNMGFGVMQFENPAEDGSQPSECYALRTIGGGPMNVTPGQANDGGRRQSYYPRAKLEVPDDLELRGDRAQSETVIRSDGRSQSSTVEDGAHLSRAGSQDLIIQKEVEWDVHHEV